MFRTLVRMLDTISDKLTALDTAWEKKKPEVEDFIIDRLLDLEETITITVEALTWMGEGAKNTALKVAKVSRCTYKAIKAIAVFTLPIVRKSAVNASMKLYEALRDIHGNLAPVRSDLESRVYHAWEFREELLKEARA